MGWGGGAFYPPGDIGQYWETFLVVTAWGSGVPTTSSGERPERLPHVL